MEICELDYATTTKCLSFDMGRHSTMVTLSPVLNDPDSSCALYFLEIFIYFPYLGCFTNRSTLTTIVFCILSETTVPDSVFEFLVSVFAIDYMSFRLIIRTFTGSFAPALRKASRATASVTPSTSNMMRPGSTSKQNPWGSPLPLPIPNPSAF